MTVQDLLIPVTIVIFVLCFVGGPQTRMGTTRFHVLCLVPFYSIFYADLFVIGQANSKAGLCADALNRCTKEQISFPISLIMLMIFNDLYVQLSSSIPLYTNMFRGRRVEYKEAWLLVAKQLLMLLRFDMRAPHSPQPSVQSNSFEIPPLESLEYSEHAPSSPLRRRESSGNSEDMMQQGLQRALSMIRRREDGWERCPITLVSMVDPVMSRCRC
mmetsp:Transcript_35971/g.94474  ORF Transcript_35971/g.94474 Transcript_35971/m.94474 type:complete len:215 (-) Transcript_35971:330-974(-)